MRAYPVDRRIARLGWVLLVVTTILIALSFVSCEPEPDEDSHHRDSPSTMKRY